MSQKRLMVQMKPEVNMREIYQNIEASGAQLLPAPQIFPPVFHMVGPEPIIDNFKQQYSNDFERVMTDETLDE
ncbi:hypothetical protein CNMCM6106_002065 [Aspergillus hiratsukae]|uniref:Uncharacterized protein n=1 Tax=Aspergillus hiratsukae TaxID=1194566 RepID=A0A8H6UTB0_9EURO|nr:hypothetical protein CNMCM6106_002065 [Aspergillus hiratsukae]